eukprot:1158851-Pelagomonas_calceolata.AAC.9
MAEILNLTNHWFKITKITKFGAAGDQLWISGGQGVGFPLRLIRDVPQNLLVVNFSAIES